MIKPITPEEAGAEKIGHIPEYVIQAFNTCIARNMQKRCSKFTQDEVIYEIHKLSEITREHIFSRNLLDVEPIYEAAGWKVEYDKPGWDESYPARFIFTKNQEVNI